MFVVNKDDNSIYATRGDVVFFNVAAEDNGAAYKFQAGDVVRIKVYGKKDAEAVVLQKDFPVTEETETVEIYLTEEDTKIGEVISKPVDYWYEVELNPYTDPQTIIGYDEDGAKVFKLFPEGKDVPDVVVEPEDVPVVDRELDMTSTRPVQNRAIAGAIAKLNAETATLANRAIAADAQLAYESARIDNLITPAALSLSQTLDYLEFITAETKAKIDGRIESDGVFATIKVNLREANLIYGGTALDMFIIPDNGRPIEVGLIHSEDGLDYRINYDGKAKRYYMSLTAKSDVTVAPSGAGTVTMTYALGDYELKDVRMGAYGNIHPTAGEAVRTQVDSIVKNLDEVLSGENVNVFWRYAADQNGGSVYQHETGELLSTRSYYSHSECIPVVPGQKVTVYLPEGDGKCVTMMGAYFDAEKNVIRGMGYYPNYASGASAEITIPDGVYYIGVNYHADYAKETAVIPHHSLPWKSEYVGKVWCCVGDSLTEANSRAAKHYHDYIAEELGLRVLNYGVSGTGYKNGSFANRIYGSIKEDFDFMTIFGSFNDLDKAWQLGNVTDSGRDTLCGCMNAAIENFFIKYPTKKLAIITPTPWKVGIEYFGVATTLENMEEYVEALLAVAKRHRLPCLDLYHCSGLNPDNPTVFTAYYNENGTQDVGVHPNSEGHKFIAPAIKAFIQTL